MKFTLTYSGELPSAGNRSKKVAEKWAIRKHIHPQIVHLWQIHPGLKEVSQNQYYPRILHLCAPVAVGGREFQPLVRDSFALTCALDILFLRQENPGKVYQGGDLDNRIKTLLDALSVPASPDHLVADAGIAGPIYCLLENDRLVTGFNVRTERLLGVPGRPESYVQLIVNVDVRVRDARLYNTSFLGD